MLRMCIFFYNFALAYSKSFKNTKNTNLINNNINQNNSIMRKLKLFSLFAAVLFAASMWAAEMEGPWTYLAMKQGGCGKYNYTTNSYYGLGNNGNWGAIDFWNDADGIGFTQKGTSGADTKQGVFSVYYIDKEIESYSKQVLTWTFQLGARATKHWSATALYAIQGNQTNAYSLTVDFTYDLANSTGSGNRLAYLKKTEYSTSYTANQTKTFEFNNYQGSSKATKSWCLLLTHTVGSSNGSTSDLHEWGAFRHVSASWATTYYSTISFNGNGSTGGSMSSMNDKSGTFNLTANAFTKTGYSFGGWATSTSGAVAYANGASYTVNQSNRGPKTLYAKWTAVNYTIGYTLNGGSVSTNPTGYTIETNTITLNNPTKDGYTFKGWTGSNGNTPQTTVQIAKGSTGNKTYTANWTPITYKITYDLAGGSGLNVESYDVETPTFQLAAPTRLGYTFIGWTGSNGDVPQPIVQIATGSTGNKNYTANWAINPSTQVQYLDSLNQTIDQEVTAFNRPEAPEIAGFTFLRWEVVEGPLSEGIKLQAIYSDNNLTGIVKPIVGKYTLIRKGDKNEYILQTAK